MYRKNAPAGPMRLKRANASRLRSGRRLLSEHLLGPSARYVPEEDRCGIPVAYVLCFSRDVCDRPWIRVARNLKIAGQGPDGVSVALGEQYLAFIAQNKIGEEAREVRMGRPFIDDQCPWHEEHSVRR